MNKFMPPDSKRRKTTNEKDGKIENKSLKIYETFADKGIDIEKLSNDLDEKNTEVDFAIGNKNSKTRKFHEIDKNDKNDDCSISNIPKFREGFKFKENKYCDIPSVIPKGRKSKKILPVILTEY